MNNVPREILVRGVNWIGDAVMTIPAMRGLRRLFPESRITLLIREPIDQIFSAFSAADRVIGFTIRPGLFGLRDRLKLMRKLRKNRYDLCLILPNSFDSALVAFLSGIPERVGFDRDGRGLLLTRKVRASEPENSAHQAEDYVTLVTSLGEVRISLDIGLEVEERAGDWAVTRLAPLRQGLQGPLIGLSPGAAYGPAKQWFPDRFADLANRLCAEKQAGIVIVGGPEETELCGAVAGRIRGNLLDLSGKTELSQAAAVLSQCDLLVTNDSGPMHLASAVGTPVAAIFGSTEPGATSPLGRHVIVKKECDCSPCLERTCERGDMLCMERVRVDDVFRAVEALLQGESSS